MSRQRVGFRGILGACILGLGAVGFLLGHTRRVGPALATLELALVVVGEVLTW